MTNSADPDQLASEEANRSGPTLFAKERYIQTQQDQGYILVEKFSSVWIKILPFGHLFIWQSFQ